MATSTCSVGVPDHSGQTMLASTEREAGNILYYQEGPEDSAAALYSTAATRAKRRAVPQQWATFRPLPAGLQCEGRRL